jgi:hypothetical protein
MKRSSWPLLFAAAAAFLAVFAWQRHRSYFLAIEAARADAEPLARDYGLALADVMALRLLLGRDAPTTAWREAVARYGADRMRLGEALAAVAAIGDRAAAEAARTAAPDADTAWQRFRTQPAAAPGLEFVAMRDRFAARTPAHD